MFEQSEDTVGSMHSRRGSIIDITRDSQDQFLHDRHNSSDSEDFQSTGFKTEMFRSEMYNVANCENDDISTT